jgi:hypothetical protein
MVENGGQFFSKLLLNIFESQCNPIFFDKPPVFLIAISSQPKNIPKDLLSFPVFSFVSEMILPDLIGRQQILNGLISGK